MNDEKKQAWDHYRFALNNAPTGSKEWGAILMAGPASFMPGNPTGEAAAQGEISIEDLHKNLPNWSAYWGLESGKDE